MMAVIVKSAEYNITEDVDLWNFVSLPVMLAVVAFYSECRGNFKNEQIVDHSFQICSSRRTVSLCTHSILEL
jgi:hypothetical protein